MTQRLLIVAAFMAASLVCVAVLRRRVDHERLRDNNEIAGLAYAIVAAIYGVYLAFTVVVVWEQFGEAERNATSEAVHLSQVWRDIDVLPAGTRDPVQDLLIAYSDSVVQEEWRSMAESAIAHPNTSRIYEDIWQRLYEARAGVETSGDAAFFNEAVVQMNHLGMSRRLRLLSATAELPSIMWVLLIGGGLLSVSLTYLIGTPHGWVQGAITSAVTGLIVFSLLIVAALQHPFAGDVSVRPDALIGVRDSLLERIQRRGTPESEQEPLR